MRVPLQRDRLVSWSTAQLREKCPAYANALTGVRCYICIMIDIMLGDFEHTEQYVRDPRFAVPAVCKAR